MYLQLPVDKELKQYLTINTHQQLCVYYHLPLGAASAPAIFQNLMDTLLQGIPRVMCYIDDILVNSADKDSHLYRPWRKCSTTWSSLDLDSNWRSVSFYLRVLNIWGHIISVKIVYSQS